MHDLVLVLVACQLGDLECLQRVRDDFRRWVVRVAAGLDHLLHLVGMALAVARVQLRAGNPVGRVLGVQVEGKPFDRGAEPAREPRRPLVGDVAERSDVVAPDPDDVWRRHATQSTGASPERVIFRHGKIESDAASTPDRGGACARRRPAREARAARDGGVCGRAGGDAPRARSRRHGPRRHDRRRGAGAGSPR